MLNDREIKIKMSVDESKVKQAFDNLDKYQGKASNGNYGTSAMQNATKAQGAMAKGWLSNSIGIGTLTTAAGPAGLAVQGLAAGVKAAGSLAVSSVKDYSTFQGTLKQVQVIAGGTQADMDLLGEAAIKVGGSTSKGAQEMADAMVDFAKLGFTAKETAEAMTGVVYAAEASGSSVETTAQIVATSLNVWHKSASEAESIADVLAKTSNETAADMTDLGYTIQYAGASASLAGASMEDLSAMAGIMANNGIRGSKAGTSLRTAFTNLIKPTDAAADALEAMGISLKDSEGQFRPTMDVIYDLQDAVKGMSDAEILDLSTTLFGKTGAAGMSFILKTTTEELKGLSSSLENSTGTASRQAAEMRKTMEGQLDQLGDSWDAIKLKIGKGITGSVGLKGVEAANAGLDAIAAGLDKTEDAWNGLQKRISNNKLEEQFIRSSNSASLLTQAFSHLGYTSTGSFDASGKAVTKMSKEAQEAFDQLQKDAANTSSVSAEMNAAFSTNADSISGILDKTYSDINKSYQAWMLGDKSPLDMSQAISESMPALEEQLTQQSVLFDNAHTEKMGKLTQFLTESKSITDETAKVALEGAQNRYVQEQAQLSGNNSRMLELYNELGTAEIGRQQEIKDEILRLQEANYSIQQSSATGNSVALNEILKQGAESGKTITQEQYDARLAMLNTNYNESVEVARTKLKEELSLINQTMADGTTAEKEAKEEALKAAYEKYNGSVDSAGKTREESKVYLDKMVDDHKATAKETGKPIVNKTDDEQVRKSIGWLDKLKSAGQSAWQYFKENAIQIAVDTVTGGVGGALGGVAGRKAKSTKKARGGLTSGVPLGMGSGATTTVGASARGVGTQLGQAGISQGGVISNEKGREVTMPIQNPTYMRPFAQAIAAELGSSVGNSQPVQVEVPLYINGAEFARATYNDTKDVDRRMTRISNRPSGKA